MPPAAVPLPKPSSVGRRSPPFWAGCDALAWGRLLARNGFAVDRSRWPVVAGVTAVCGVHTALGLAQQILYGRAVARACPRQPPVFVLGHWRSGTTLLHELLARDPRHAAPTTYECFNPRHFLVTGGWLPRRLGRLMPARRPMDAMAAGWDRPQEDEFALALMGQPSVLDRVAFPNRPAAGVAALDLTALSPGARRAWGRALTGFVRALVVRHGGRRLVFKSPAHTARLPTLLGLFPDARFVHVVRDPYAVYPSTLHLWRVLFAAHGLQRPGWGGLPEFVLDTFDRMDRAFEAGRRLVPPGQLCEVRYEDLVADPVGRLETAYRELGLGDFGPARRPVEEYLAIARGHEPNAYVLTPEERRAVTRRWGAFFRRYGYPTRDD